ncbi:class I SAM-dependent methyltransferase [Natrialbaceae archaeon A-arb3/5]
MTFQDYLEAKRTVDDRALNRRVLDRFATELADRSPPVRIVELGAGVGTMIPRLAVQDRLPPRVVYRAVDHDAENISRARKRVPVWLEQAGYEIVSDCRDSTADFVAGPDSASTRTLVAEAANDGSRSDNRRIAVTFEVADAFSIADDADAVVASAFLDLVDLEDAIPAIEALLADDGLLYAPITFDGGTTFSPRDQLDDRIERWYHWHMDRVRSGGCSRAGRTLLAAVPDNGWTLLEAGGSDWIVRPVGDGYRADERAVIARVLGTIDDALAAIEATAVDGTAATPIETAERRRWFDRRERELDRGDLVYVAHNLDVLASAPADGANEP